MRLTSSKTGVKEELILASPNAPDRFVFPLRLKGLTASLDENGDVVYKDSQGKERARTPHGYMFDSNVDPLSDEPARSNGVTYALIAHGSGTALEVTLDRAWLNSSERVWPVTVDPDIYIGTWGDDTFVMSPYNNDYSGSTELSVGTFNGGGNKARSFMHFNTGGLPGPVTFAELQMRELHSYNCNNPPETIHRVTSGWNGSTLRTFPGANIDGWTTWGGWVPNSGSCHNRLATWNVTGDVQGWQNSGETAGSFAAVAGNENDSYQWKKYRSVQAGNGPVLKVVTNHAPTISNVTPVNGARVLTSGVPLSARYGDADGAGYVGFGVYNTSGQLVWNGWSGLVGNNETGYVTTSALSDGQCRVNGIASDGSKASTWTSGQWFTIDTVKPGTPTALTPAQPSSTGSSLRLSPRSTRLLSQRSMGSLTISQSK